MKHQFGFIIHLAQKAGFDVELWKTSIGCDVKGTHEELERFADIITSIVREECAALCDAEWDNRRGFEDGTAFDCAKIIRARNKK